MRRFKYILPVIIFISLNNLFAQNIQLKKSFLGEVQYSIDSINYSEVKTAELKEIMKDNAKALKLMDSYRSNETASEIFAIPGGALIGWPLGGYIGSGGKWNNGYTAMIITGCTLSVIAFLFESHANSKLYEAVSEYNNGTTSISDKINFELRYVNSIQSFNFLLKYNL